MPKLKAVLFDIDGTLVDSNDFHVAAWDEVFREEGFVLGRDAIHAQVGKGGDNLVPALLPDAPDDVRERIAGRHGEVYKARYIDRVQPFPGARALMARAREEGLTIVLASSAKGEELDHYVELLDARDLIDDATSKDDVEHSKPDPDIFAAALKQAGVKPEEAMVIGDTPYDAIAAAKCGIRTIGLLSGGFDEAALREGGAAFVYRDAAHLLDRYDNSPLAAGAA